MVLSDKNIKKYSKIFINKLKKLKEIKKVNKEQQNYIVSQLVSDYVSKTNVLPNPLLLQSLGMTSTEIRNIYNLQNVCKNGNINEISAIKALLKKYPELKALNLSNCNITTELIDYLFTTNIEEVKIDKYFTDDYIPKEVSVLFNIKNNTSTKNIKVVFNKWISFFNLLGVYKPEILHNYESRIGTLSQIENMSHDDIIEKYIRLNINEFNAQDGLNSLLKYFKHDKYLYEYFEFIDDCVIYKHPVIKIIKLFLNYDAIINTYLLVPTANNLGYNSYQDLDIKNCLKEIKSLSPEYLKKFIFEEESYYIYVNYKLLGNCSNLINLLIMYKPTIILPYIYNYLPKNWNNIINNKIKLNDMTLIDRFYLIFKQLCYIELRTLLDEYKININKYINPNYINLSRCQVSYEIIDNILEKNNNLKKLNLHQSFNWLYNISLSDEEKKNERKKIINSIIKLNIILLDISNNIILGDLKEISKMNSLKILSAEYCNTKNINFKLLENLNEIDLTGNEILNSQLKDISELKNLKVLYLKDITIIDNKNNRLGTNDKQLINELFKTKNIYLKY